MFLAGVSACLLLLGVGATPTFEVAKMAALVADLSLHFRRSVYILTGPDPEPQPLDISVATSVRRIRKELSKYNIPTTVSFLNTTLFQNRTSPLFVIFESIVSVKNLLQLVPRQLLSSSKWLIHLKDVSRLKDVFRGVYIPFDCELIAVQNRSAKLKATEVYRVGEGLPLRLLPIPVLTISADALPALYQRRRDLSGFVFRVSTVNYPPMLNVQGNHISGYFGDIWNNVTSAINCSSLFVSPNDSSWGKVGADGSWNGMIGMLLRDEADLAVDAFSFTTNRLDVVDFSVPILETRISVFVGLRITGDMKWETYVEPFSGELWIAVVLCLVVLSLFMTLLYRLGNEETEQPGERMFHNPILSIFYASGIFCLQGLWVLPESVPVRMLVLTSYWLAMVLLGAYSAFLIAALTVAKPMLLFTDFREMMALGTYRLGMAKTSGLLNIFDQSIDPLMKSIYNKLILPGIGNLPDSSEDVVNRLCNSKYAYMRSQILRILSDTPECNIVPVTKSSFAETMGIVFPKASPYKGIIDYQLLQHKEIGVFKRTANNIWPKLDNAEGAFETLGFNSVVAVFALLLTGMIASVFLLAMEHTRLAHIFNIHPRFHKEKYAIDACEETEEPEYIPSQLSDTDNQSVQTSSDKE